MVHGGDGFAFVFYGNERRSKTLDQAGMDVGYGGIENSSFKFDTWWNPVNGDLFEDHVSIRPGVPYYQMKAAKLRAS